jgi:hypothetical protein
LLSYDESSMGNTSPVNSLNAVKEHVTNMRSMISLSKSQELEEQELKRAYKRAESSMDDQILYSTFSSSTSSVLSNHASLMRPKMMKKCSPVMKCLPCPPPCASAPSGSMQQQQLQFSCMPEVPQLNQIQIQIQKQGNEVQKVDGLSSNFADHENESNSSNNNNNYTAPSVQMVDYTKFPSLLDSRYEELDSDSVLRPTIINAGCVWSKKSFKSLMSEAETKPLHTDDQVLEKNAAFDLLDALSKSGALVMHSASLHVVIAATHCFDKSLMDTVVQGNVNPIERVERSALIMASTIHEKSASDLISENQRSRVLTYSPQLKEQNALCG